MNVGLAPCVCKGRGRAFALAGALLGLALAQSGCAESGASLAGAAQEHSAPARRGGVSLAAASVAFVSLEGAPASVVAEFDRQMSAAAAAQDIKIAEAAKARYLLRGYFWARQTDEGAEIAYVWDIFTHDKRRSQRVSDVILVKGADEDVWKMVDASAIASLTAKSAQDISAYLSYTPEASVLAKPAPDTPAHPLSYAPLE